MGSNEYGQLGIGTGGQPELKLLIMHILRN